MTVKELMERAGTNQTGRAIAYIKDGLEEMQMLTEIHTRVQRLDINANQRFYTLPNEMIKMIDIRCKNHLNSKDEYRSIPRMLNKPAIKDGDNI
tara:strand:- start:9368 stop:9649 length:282 start_codon:yes stop_codon:yes gene_type:complete